MGEVPGHSREADRRIAALDDVSLGLGPILARDVRQGVEVRVRADEHKVHLLGQAGEHHVYRGYRPASLLQPCGDATVDLSGRQVQRPDSHVTQKATQIVLVLVRGADILNADLEFAEHRDDCPDPHPRASKAPQPEPHAG